MRSLSPSLGDETEIDRQIRRVIRIDRLDIPDALDDARIDSAAKRPVRLYGCLDGQRACRVAVRIQR